MGDLSEHFNKKDFICKCPECKGREFKIHLGLVGALELLEEHFKKKVEVLTAFWCEAFCEAQKKEKRSFHLKGKAAHIRVPGVELNEVFKFLESMPEINGLGFYPKEDLIHLDTRPAEKRELWVKEDNRYSPLTAEKRRQYKLEK